MKKGNQKAFTTLFDFYWEAMFIKAQSILGNREIAQDVVQEIWINLYRKREELEISNFDAYIFKCVSYGCYKYLRKNSFNISQLHIIDSLSLSSSPIENHHDLEEIQEVIDKSLNKLSPRCQQIFRLSRMEDSTNEEIALKLGITKRAVENQISLALSLLRKCLASFRIILFLFLLFIRYY